MHLTAEASCSMCDEIEIHFDEKHGRLSLACGEAAFARIRDRVFEEALIPEIVGPPSAEARYIEIESVSTAPANRRKTRRGPVGLAVDLATVTALLVFLVGLWTILKWVLRGLAVAG